MATLFTLDRQDRNEVSLLAASVMDGLGEDLRDPDAASEAAGSIALLKQLRDAVGWQVKYRKVDGIRKWEVDASILLGCVRHLAEKERQEMLNLLPGYVGHLKENDKHLFLTTESMADGLAKFGFLITLGAEVEAMIDERKS